MGNVVAGCLSDGVVERVGFGMRRDSNDGPVTSVLEEEGSREDVSVCL